MQKVLKLVQEVADKAKELSEDLRRKVTVAELMEETGALEFSIKPVCVYSVTGRNRVNNTGGEMFGMLYFAEITKFEKELHSEMEKVFLSDTLPSNWTYPLIQPKLIEEAARRGFI